MPTPYPKEFRRDVVAVARQGGQTLPQVARSFGISESCLARWLSIADRDDGTAAVPVKPAAQFRPTLRQVTPSVRPRRLCSVAAKEHGGGTGD